MQKKIKEVLLKALEDVEVILKPSLDKDVDEKFQDSNLSLLKCNLS